MLNSFPLFWLNALVAAMHLTASSTIKVEKAPPALLNAAWIAVVLAPVLPFVPKLQTFIHPWKAEMAAAAGILVFLFWIYRQKGSNRLLDHINRREIKFLLIPLLAFTAWGSLSIVWAGSPLSVIHHSSNWFVYILFYLFFRKLTANGRSAETSISAAMLATCFVCLPMIADYLIFVLWGDQTPAAVTYSKYTELVNVLLPIVFAAGLRAKGRYFLFCAATAVIITLFDIASSRRIVIAIVPFILISFGLAVVSVKSLRSYRRKYLIISAAMIFIPILVHAIPMIAFSSDLPIVNRVRDPKTSESTGLRLAFASVALEMFKAHPLVGVGADNYGQRFDSYLQVYAREHPNDTDLTGTELGIAERAHNEYLQILSELGIIGFVLFTGFLAGIAKLIYDAIRSGRRLQIQTFGAVLGLVCFLINSLISSYSFRVTQNALMFFFALALVVSQISRREQNPGIVEARPPVRSFRPSLAVLAACCVFFIVFGSIRVLSVHYVNLASAALTIDEALPLYRTAMILDPENANAHTAAASHLISAGRSEEASIDFQKAIALGQTLPADYSFLATSQIVSGQLEDAEKTLARGAAAYPFSVFLSTRHAVILKDLGRIDQSDAAFANALRIDRGEAKTWWNLVNSGGRVASQKAFDDKLPTVMELRTESAVFAAIADREIRFPEERPKMGF